MVFMNGVSFHSITSSITEHIPLSVLKITGLALDIFAEYGAELCMGLCSAYQFYQGYRCRQHNPFQLDNRLKPVKCEILLKEIERKRRVEDLQVLLKECQNLIASIKPDISIDHKKEELTFRLALQFADSDPEKFYALVRQLNNPYKLHNAAERLIAKHPQFDPAKVIELLQKALNLQVDHTKWKHTPPQLDDLEFVLKIAKTSYKLQDSRLTDAAFKEALGLTGYFDKSLDEIIASVETAKNYREINDFKNETTCLLFARKRLQDLSPLEKFKGFNHLAKYYHTINDHENMNTCLISARQLLESKTIEKKDLLVARFSLARTYLDFQDVDDLEQELQSEIIVQFLENHDGFNQDELDTLEGLVGLMLSSKGEFLPEFDDFKKTLIKRLRVTIISLRNPKKLLSCASACKRLGFADTAKEAVSLAFNHIRNVEKEKLSEMLLKIIDFYPYKDSAEEILPMLSMLQNVYHEMSFDKDLSRKTDVAIRIILLLNAMNSNCNYQDSSATNFSEKADAFLNSYISDLVKDKKTPFDVVSELTTCAFHYDKLTETQKKALLEEAEKCLPKVLLLQTPHVTSMITEAYLKVDVKESERLIEQHQNSEGQYYYLLGTISAVAMVALYIDPVTTGLAITGVKLLNYIYSAGRDLYIV